MRSAAPVALCAAALLLAGCGSAQRNPYAYRYAEDEVPVVCFIADAKTPAALALQARQAILDKGVMVRDIASDAQAAECERCVRFDAVTGGWSGMQVSMARMVMTEKGGKVRFAVTLSNTPARAGLMSQESDPAVMMRNLADKLFPVAAPWLGEPI
ncbi:MAG: hypothetical protein HUK26_06600 [Duodenibacillus sp.]|nr:hypothetical protein [Duodenibacillus sp.]